MSDITALLAQKVLDRLGTYEGIDIVDGGILKTPSRPYAAFYAGVAVSEEQRFCDARPRERLPVTVMIVNNSAGGTRFLAGKVVDLLDDFGRQPTDGLRCSPTSSSDLITDDEVEGDWRYSITTYFDARES
jgi:hypothetical protein